jgi:hypothetical protein
VRRNLAPAQFASTTPLAIDAAFQLKLPNGVVNANSRRNVDVKILNPSGDVIVHRERVWRELKLSAPDTIPGRYRLWCVASPGNAEVLADQLVARSLRRN